MGKERYIYLAADAAIAFVQQLKLLHVSQWQILLQQLHLHRQKLVFTLNQERMAISLPSPAMPF